MNDTVREITTCRSCGSGDLEGVLDLGVHYLSTFPMSREEGERTGRKVPLHMVLCRQCWLTQLKHTTPPDWLYRHFWYRSGITQTMRDVLAEIVREASEYVSLKDGDYVCDIGANDGTLLRNYRAGAHRVGFEPALNLLREAEQGGNIIVSDYFKASSTGTGHYKIITAIAMFYDLDDPHQFLEDVRTMLHADGVFIVQMNYLPKMLHDCAFDNIGHEHLTYYSMTSLAPLLDRHGLKVISTKLNDVNGGSVQVWCAHKSSVKPSGGAQPLIDWERSLSLNTPSKYMWFAGRVKNTGEELRHILESAGRERTYLCGASTRGNTLLQTFGIDHTMVSGAGERDERKWGCVTPGTWIPIIDERIARDTADTMLVLPWQFAAEITCRETPYLKRGGRLIFPLPMPREVRAAVTDEVRV